MILYFSATGNSEHVARRIAAATDDKVVSIERFDAEALRLVATEGPCQLGFVAPVYAWGLPTPMIEFLKTADLSICLLYTSLVAGFGAMEINLVVLGVKEVVDGNGVRVAIVAVDGKDAALAGSEQFARFLVSDGAFLST